MKNSILVILIGTFALFSTVAKADLACSGSYDSSQGHVDLGTLDTHGQITFVNDKITGLSVREISLINFNGALYLALNRHYQELGHSKITANLSQPFAMELTVLVDQNAETVSVDCQSL